MILAGKLKKAALFAAVDICLRKMKNSPKRCARNLLELGVNAFPNRMDEEEKADFYRKLLQHLESGDLQAVKALYTSMFL